MRFHKYSSLKGSLFYRAIHTLDKKKKLFRDIIKKCLIKVKFGVPETSYKQTASKHFASLDEITIEMRCAFLARFINPSIASLKTSSPFIANSESDLGACSRSEWSHHFPPTVLSPASCKPISITESGVNSGSVRYTKNPGREKIKSTSCERKFARSFEITAAGNSICLERPEEREVLSGPADSRRLLRDCGTYSRRKDARIPSFSSARVYPCRTTSNEALGVGERPRNPDDW